MLPLDLYRLAITRRHFLQECGIGLGRVALATLLAQSTFRSRVTAADTAPNRLAPRKPHFPGKARRVIHLFMGGAPSQLELFDYKPMLAELEGQPLPESHAPTRQDGHRHIRLASGRRDRGKAHQVGVEIQDILERHRSEGRVGEGGEVVGSVR